MTETNTSAPFVASLRGIMGVDAKLRASQKVVLQEFLGQEDTPEKMGFNLAIGVGKTWLMAMALAHMQVQPDSKIIVVVPNNHLIVQEQEYFRGNKKRQDRTAERALSPLNISEMMLGRYDKEDRDTDSQIIFTTYNSLGTLADKLNTDQKTSLCQRTWGQSSTPSGGIHPIRTAQKTV